jgi:hypothetical protein
MYTCLRSNQSEPLPIEIFGSFLDIPAEAYRTRSPDPIPAQSGADGFLFRVSLLLMSFRNGMYVYLHDILLHQEMDFISSQMIQSGWGA